MGFPVIIISMEKHEGVCDWMRPPVGAVEGVSDWAVEGLMERSAVGRLDGPTEGTSVGVFDGVDDGE